MVDRTKSFVAQALAIGVAVVAGQSHAQVYEHEHDGLHFRVFADGSGSVALGPGVQAFRWWIDCRVDAMDDRRHCYLSSMDGLFISFGATDRPTQVCVSGHDFPGRTAMIRIDRNPPITTSERGCVAAETIMPQLLAGAEVTTRRVRWPRDFNVDTTTTLEGLSAALGLIARILNNEFDGL